MKAPTQTQITLILGIVGIALVFYGVKKVSDKVGSVTGAVSKVVNDYVVQPVQSVTTALGSIANQEMDGAAFLAGQLPQAPAVQATTGRKYSDPLVNNDGVNFNYF